MSEEDNNIVAVDWDVKMFTRRYSTWLDEGNFGARRFSAFLDQFSDKVFPFRMALAVMSALQMMFSRLKRAEVVSHWRYAG